MENDIEKGEAIEKICGSEVCEIEIFIEIDFFGDREITLGSAFLLNGTRKEFVCEIKPFESEEFSMIVFDSYKEASEYFLEQITNHRWLKEEKIKEL